MISDITPVPLVAGPLVLYRHFIRMKEHKILVISGDIPEADPPDRTWDVVRLPRRLRLLRRPLTWPLFEEWRAVQIERETNAAVDHLAPDVILSVWMTEYLLAASRIAAKRHLPLVIICHDDLERMLPNLPHLKLWARHRLAGIYRQAVSRLCVSEGMEKSFRARYGAPGTILYPIGGTSQPITHSPGNGAKRAESLRFGYAGRFGPSEFSILLSLADLLRGLDGQLHLASPSEGPLRETLRRHPAVVDQGLLTPEKTYSYFCQSVDVMVVAQSFEPQDREMMETNFPSKLVDCSRFGLALMIVSPPSGSAAVWAKAHLGASLLVDRMDGNCLAEAVRRLSDVGERARLAERLRHISQEDFSSDRIHSVLEDALQKAQENQAVLGRQP